MKYTFEFVISDCHTLEDKTELFTHFMKIINPTHPSIHEGDFLIDDNDYLVRIMEIHLNFAQKMIVLYVQWLIKNA